MQRELDCSTAGCLLSPTGPSQLFSWADIAKSILGASQRCHGTMESAARGCFAPAEGERQNIAVHSPHGEGFCPPSQLSTWEDCECRVRGHSCGSRRALKPTQRLQRKEISSRKKCEAPGETSADRLGKAQPQLAGALPPPEQSSVPSHHAWHSQTRHGDGAVAISNLYKAWLRLYSSQKTSRTCFLIFFFLQLCSLLKQSCEPPAPTRVPSRLQSLPSALGEHAAKKKLGLEAGRCERELLFLEKLSWPTGTEDMEGSGG